jgi:hypothetical protein
MLIKQTFKVVYFTTGEFLIEIFSLGKANSIGGVMVSVLDSSVVDRGEY